MAKRRTKSGSSDIFFSWAPKSLQTVTAAVELKMPDPWKESHDKPRQYIKKQRHVNPWLIHVNVWQKPLQSCKVISLQLIKIIGK